MDDRGIVRYIGVEMLENLKMTVVFVVIGSILLQSVVGQFGGDGSSSFNYDASSACSKPYSRNGRTLHEKLPCDFARQNWCTVAGSAYPWHAVRRFVYENQGLMRRMYGDEKHINVLKDELEKNDIELEYEEKFHRYMDALHPSMHSDPFDFGDYQVNEAEKPEYRSHSLPSKSPKQRRFPRLHFRSTEITSSTAASPTPPADPALPVKNVNTTTMKPSKTPPSDLNDTREKTNDKSSVAGVTLAEIARVKNSSLNEIPGTLGVKENSSRSSVTEVPYEAEVISVESTVETKSNGSAGWVPTIASIDQVDLDDPDVMEREEPLSIIDGEQQFRPRPEYRPTESQTDTASTKGQLFQDFVVKDQQEQPILKLRGVNACPVKDEVVAPFWANNTKGEILALLNLYPFQQFVHWEKCTYENKQMYCREGCKCEQQYRLYRLLAYDPNNECRGIFSDWFKFPSCCVCRCYDLPIEFRVTSRSPRSHKQTLKIQQPESP